jgi:hypothetical protein
VEVFGGRGAARVDCQAVASPADFLTMYREFVAVARGEMAPVADIERGLHLQRIIAEAEAQLRQAGGAGSHA